MIYHKLLKRIAHFQTHYPYVALALILILTVIMAQGAKEVRTVASLENMMPADIDEIKAFNTLRDNNLGQDMIGVVIELNRDSSLKNGPNEITEKQVLNYIKDLKDIIDSNKDIITSYSLNENPTLVNTEKTKTVIIATTDISADDTRMNLLVNQLYNDINNLGKPTNIKVSLTGTPIIQQQLGKLIAKDRKSTQWISTLLVFIIIMIIFGTFTSALVPIIIVTISITGLYGIMGYTGLPISTLAGGVAAMVVGIGIDYAIHLMNKFKYERKKGMNINQAIESAVVDTGTALTATSLTTIAAFLAFLTGAMPEMQRFGTLMAIGVGYSLFTSIFGLPALLVIEEQIIGKLKNKMKFGIEGELMLTDKNKKCPEGFTVLKAKEIRKGQRIMIKKDIVHHIKFDKKKYKK